MKRLLLGLALMLPLGAAADTLTSCTNLGFAPASPGYTITGTTYEITSADTIADVNALSLSPGDAVLFEAGTTWNIGSEANRLIARQGVLYGRFGSGDNPVISADGVGMSINFRGIVDVLQDDVTIDGVDFNGYGSGAGEPFGVYVNGANNFTIRRGTVSDIDGGGIVIINSNDVLVEYMVVTNVDVGGGPQESITIDSTDTYTVRYNRITDNGHAGINNKGNAKNGEVYENEIVRTNDDTMLYVERAENLVIRDNWVHQQNPTGTHKALFAVNIEPFGSTATQYNRNIDVYDNVFSTVDKFGVRFWIKDGVTGPATQLQHDIRFFNNTVIDTNNEGTSYWSMVDAYDSRTTPDSSDWSSNVIRDNIFWDNGASDGIDLRTGTASAFTVEYNLFETGETGGSDLGTNAVYTSTAPFVDLANDDYTPAGAAVGASSTGGNIGADITWTCGLSSPPNPPVAPRNDLPHARIIAN